MSIEKFVNANLLITNGYLNYNAEGRQYFQVILERLKQKIDKVLVEHQGQVMIPCSSKAKILELLLTLEEFFASKPREQAASSNAGAVGD